MTCTIHIHSILCVFLHLVAGVAKIARKCRAWQARHTNRSSSTSVISLPENVPKTRANNATVKRIVGWNREWTVIPGIYRHMGIYQVYAGIYLVYTKKLKRGQVAGSDSNPGPLAFIEARPYVSGYPLHLSVSPPFFCRDVHIITFLILWISSISHKSRMTKGNEASCAALQARKEKETTNKKKGKHETNSSDDSDDDNEHNEEWTQAPTGTSLCWQLNNGLHDCTGWSQEPSEKG